MSGGNVLFPWQFDGPNRNRSPLRLITALAGKQIAPINMKIPIICPLLLTVPLQFRLEIDGLRFRDAEVVNDLIGDPVARSMLLLLKWCHGLLRCFGAYYKNYLQVSHSKSPGCCYSDAAQLLQLNRVHFNTLCFGTCTLRLNRLNTLFGCCYTQVAFTRHKSTCGWLKGSHKTV